LQGVLPNGNHVAVKQLFNIDAQKDIDDFLNEVVLLTSVKHRNLVNLKGCCLHKNQRWLVFEYVENSDIDQILFGTLIHVIHLQDLTKIHFHRGIEMYSMYYSCHKSIILLLSFDVY